MNVGPELCLLTLRLSTVRGLDGGSDQTTQPLAMGFGAASLPGRPDVMVWPAAVSAHEPKFQFPWRIVCKLPCPRDTVLDLPLNQLTRSNTIIFTKVSRHIRIQCDDVVRRGKRTGPPLRLVNDSRFKEILGNSYSIRRRRIAVWCDARALCVQGPTEEVCDTCCRRKQRQPSSFNSCKG